MRAGEIDETLINAEQWETDQTNNDEFYARNTKVTGVQWVSFHFDWNCKTPFFSDKRVRKAMSFAFDHEEMLDKLFYGLYEPSMGPFHPTAWMAPKNLKPYKQDLDKAEDLLSSLPREAECSADLHLRKNVLLADIRANQGRVDEARQLVLREIERCHEDDPTFNEREKALSEGYQAKHRSSEYQGLDDMFHRGGRRARLAGE